MRAGRSLHPGHGAARQRQRQWSRERNQPLAAATSMVGSDGFVVIVIGMVFIFVIVIVIVFVFCLPAMHVDGRSEAGGGRNDSSRAITSSSWTSTRATI